MMISPRPLALAAVLTVFAGVNDAAAQTLVVRQAPPGSTIELVVNTTPVGSKTVDAAGDAVVPVNLPAIANKSQMDAYVYVDVCENLRRVTIVERGQTPAPPDAGCQRNQVLGLYLVRRVSSVVVNVGGPTPTMLLRQGSYSLAPPKTWTPSFTGLMVSAGGGLATFANANSVACGNASQCSADDTGLGYTVGASYWLTPFIGAEATYIKPPKATADGSGGTYRFNSSLDVNVLTVAGAIGAPVGPVRIYGKVGATYHSATMSTTETIDATTVTIDDVEQTIPGGTQTLELKTAGWGWLVGGALEIWLAPRFAIYSEGGVRATLKGDSRDGGEGELDDRLTYIFAGGRVRIGFAR